MVSGLEHLSFAQVWGLTCRSKFAKESFFPFSGIVLETSRGCTTQLVSQCMIAIRWDGGAMEPIQTCTHRCTWDGCNAVLCEMIR
jgi:hypothetical protein